MSADWDPEDYEDPRTWRSDDPEIVSLFGNCVITQEGIMDERRALKRVLYSDKCWRCATHKAESDIGLCDSCSIELRDIE